MIDTILWNRLRICCICTPKPYSAIFGRGKLRAAKIGKSWRVTGHDLSRFTEDHRQGSGMESSPLPVQARASAVVDITINSRENADRIINAMNAVMHTKPPEYGQASLVTQWMEADHIVRFTLWGNLAFMAAAMDSMRLFLQQIEEESK